MLQHDEVLKMAKQAQVHEELCGEHFIYEFAKLVASKEREACAKECEHTALRMGSEWIAQHCAEAIRARGVA